MLCPGATRPPPLGSVSRYHTERLYFHPFSGNEVSFSSSAGKYQRTPRPGGESRLSSLFRSGTETPMTLVDFRWGRVMKEPLLDRLAFVESSQEHKLPGPPK